MSSEEYRTESLETYGTSSEEVRHGSEMDPIMDMIPISEVEKEIEDEHYDDFKPHVEMLVEVGRKELKPLDFTNCFPSDRPGMILEILPKVIFETVETETGIEEVDFPKPIFRLTIDQGTIATVEYSDSSAQTSRSKLVNSWCQYEPRLFSEENRASILSSGTFDSFLKKAEEGVFESLIQNKTADTFFSELKSLYSEEVEVEAKEQSTLSMMGSFVCFQGDQKQIINHISWHPVLKDVFVVSTVCDKKFKRIVADSLKTLDESFLFYVWSCKNQFMPKGFLEFFDEITLHKINPTFPNVVVGGTLTGHLILWDLAEKGLSENTETDDFVRFKRKPTTVLHITISNAEHNHIGAIKDIVWVPSHIEVLQKGIVKSNSSNESYQLVTCAPDGIIKFWDLRAGFQGKTGFSVSRAFQRLDTKWEPFHSIEVLLGQKSYLSLTKFVFRESTNAAKLDKNVSESDDGKPPAQLSSEFYAGCDDGQVFCGNFKLYKDEHGKFMSYPPKLFKSPHSGAITALVLSPFICDIFLSTGARTVCLWQHKIKEVPIYSKDMHKYITSAEWSNTRPALFILGYADGCIEMWDFLHKFNEPYLISYVSAAAITALSVQSLSDENHVVAVGDSEGMTYVLSLPIQLWEPKDNELEFMKEFVEKQALRKEPRLKGKAPKPSKVAKTETHEKIPIRKEINIENKYKDFLELERIQLRSLGLLDEDETEQGDNDL